MVENGCALKCYEQTPAASTVPSTSKNCEGKCTITRTGAAGSYLYEAKCMATEKSCKITDFGADKYCCTTDDCNNKIVRKCFKGEVTDEFLTGTLSINVECSETEQCKLTTDTSMTPTKYTGGCHPRATPCPSNIICCDHPNCNAVPLFEKYPKLETANNSGNSKNSLFGVSLLVSIVMSKLFTL